MDICWRCTFCCCARRAGRRRRLPPPCSARVLCVYRLVAEYRAGILDLGLAVETEAATVPPRLQCASLKRSLLALIKRVPAAYGWCRTRWSCQTLTLELRARRGVSVSPDTIRRWLHQLGYVWKRARHVARDESSCQMLWKII